jgi:hypothetical protein
MARREARLVTLFEDVQHRAFLRCVLKGLGFGGRIVRELPPATGEGGGFGYVLKRYPIEVAEHRKKRNHQPALRLVVMLDGDDQGVAGRLKELDQELQADQQDKKQPAEGIVVLVPTRNIETWIHWLEGNAVDEETAYPKYKCDEKACRPAAKRLVELIHSGQELPANCPSSLKLAVQELRKLK